MLAGDDDLYISLERVGIVLTGRAAVAQERREDKSIGDGCGGVL